jgi:hypothetical protein
MDGEDDSRLRARLAELKRQRETAGKTSAGGRLTPASADERRERLRAMREKRLAQHEDGDAPTGGAAKVGGAREGGRGGLLRALAEKRAKSGGSAGGGAEGTERRGEFLQRVLARRNEAPAGAAMNGGERPTAERMSAERPMAGLLRRRMGQAGGAEDDGGLEDPRKTRERLEKMIRKLEDRLEQLDGKPVDIVTTEVSSSAEPLEK